jgi:hypothetical protein
MVNPSDDRDVRHQLDILQLLDDRYRLREDPHRRPDLDLTHARLRERLDQSADDETTAGRKSRAG